MQSDIDIETLRRDLGNESQATFAARFGVSQSAVSLWEKNGPPSRGPIRKMLDELKSEIARPVTTEPEVSA